MIYLCVSKDFFDLKQSGTCPKCEGTKIWNNSYWKQEGTRPSKRWIIVVWAFRHSKRKYAFKDEYVCLDCGYSETFIDDEGIKTIQEYGGLLEVDSHKDSDFAE